MLTWLPQVASLTESIVFWLISIDFLRKSSCRYLISWRSFPRFEFEKSGGCFWLLFTSSDGNFICKSLATPLINVSLSFAQCCCLTEYVVALISVLNWPFHQLPLTSLCSAPLVSKKWIRNHRGLSKSGPGGTRRANSLRLSAAQNVWDFCIPQPCPQRKKIRKSDFL